MLHETLKASGTMRKIGMLVMAAMLCLGMTLFAGAEEPAAEAKSVEQLQEEFLELQSGMFIHYNMETYQGVQWGEGYYDVADFNPGGVIDTDAWAEAAASAGLEYGVLTAKHVSGFCLWDSPSTAYDSVNEACPYPQDVVKNYAESFRKQGLKVGLYYCWRNPGFGSEDLYKVLPPECDPATHTTEEELAFQKEQIAELLTQYGDIFYLWNDGADQHVIEAQELKDFVRAIQPNCIISCNMWDWGEKGTQYGDLAVYETTLPPAGNQIPAEACATLESSWFWYNGTATKMPESLIPALRFCSQNNTNYLLNVGPDQSGAILDSSIQALERFGELRTASDSETAYYVDDTSERLQYSDGWYHDALNGCYGSTRHYTDRAGETVKLSFEGTGVSVISDLEYNRGRINIYVDGIFRETVDCVGTTLLQVPVFEVNDLPFGDHEIVLETVDEGIYGNFIFDAILVKGANLVDDAEEGIVYTGGWASDVYPGYINYTRHYTEQSGSTMEYTFTGTGIRVIADKHMNRGAIDVWIDGELVGKDISGYHPTEILQVSIFEITGLEYGTHTIQILDKELEGRKHFIFDAFEVLGTKKIANVAENKTVDATEAAQDRQAKYAVDQDLETAYASVSARNPYLELDLELQHPSISHVQVFWGDQEPDPESRYYVFVSDEPLPKELDSALTECAQGAGTSYSITGDAVPATITVGRGGRYVRVQKQTEDGRMHIAELKVLVKVEDLPEVPVPSVTTYQLRAEQSEGGRISPTSRVVGRGGSATFTITPDEGYTISDVLVDGKSVGAVDTYTFEKVSARHTITAEFAEGGETDKTVAGFDDVYTDDWFADAVEYVADEGLMNGTSETAFSPKNATTRGMIVTILYRLAGAPDVESDGAAWWSDARVWAMETGVSDGTNMEKPITREQLAAMLYRYAGSEEVEGDLSAFADAAQVSDWATDALIWATSNEIVTGKTGNVLDPQAGATRAETAAVLMRYAAASF